MLRTKSLTLGFLLVLFPSVQAAAQEPEEVFSPDRPGFADSTGLVPRGRWMTELGAEGTREADATGVTFAGLLIRTGLLEGLELRLGAPSVEGVFADGASEYGLGDPSLGVKTAASISQSLSGSIVLGTTLPLGTESFGGSEAEPSVSVNMAYDMSESLNLSGNVLAAYRIGDEGREFEWGGSCAVGVAATDAVGVYVEGFATAAGGEWFPGAGAGVTYQVMERTQLDGYVAQGLGEPAGSTVGVGIARQW